MKIKKLTKTYGKGFFQTKKNSNKEKIVNKAKSSLSGNYSIQML